MASGTGERGGHKAGGSSLLALCTAALGVVYGDIGTSPLYAFKECFAPEHGMPPTADERAAACCRSSSGRSTSWSPSST